MEQASLQAALQQLRKKYLEDLPDKLDTVSVLFQQYQSDQNPDTRETLLSKVHQLAGSGTTFGCEGISTVAREMVDLCRSEHGFQEFIYYWNPLLLRLRKFAREYIEQGNRLLNSKTVPLKGVGSARTEIAPLIYILDNDPIYLDLLATPLRAKGYSVNKFTSSQAFIDALTVRVPEVAVIDMMLADDGPAGESVAHLCAEDYGVPVIMMSVGRDFESRLAAVRAGALSYLTKPVTMTSFLEAIDRYCHLAPAEPYRILLVDDDVALTELYARQLTAAGMVVYTVNQPGEVMDKIAEYDPEIIILDINMPDISGIELGAVIRQYEKYDHIPIVFLTVDSSLQTRVSTSLLGGDDFFQKPIPPEVLEELVRGRAVRARDTRRGSLELRRVRKRLEMLNNAANEHSIIAITDIRGEIKYVNQRFLDIYGYDESEIIGNTHQVLSAGYHDAGFFQDLWDTITAGEIWQGQLINRSKQGDIYYLDTTIVPEMDDAGLASQYIAISTDITPIKRLEQHLTKEAERLNLALESTQSGMWEIDIGKGRTFFSDSWCRYFGHDFPMQKRHGYWHELIHPDDYESILNSLLRVMEPGSGIVRSEHRFKNRNNEYDWVMDACCAVDIDADGWPIRIVGITHLINERKMMEENQRKIQQQWMQSQKLEAVGHLTAGVAHDFNNMLGAMLGYAELIKELVPKAAEAPDKMKKYLNEINTAGKRAKELIAQMLTFARLSPDLSEEETPVTLIQPIIKEVVYMLGSSIPSSININYSLSDENIRTRIQPVQLHQIFLNLAVNARDAMEDYGQIDIAITQTAVTEHCASCSENIEGEYVEICVADTGCGIPENILKRVFDPFYTTKEVNKGSGMGLSVVHGVVHALGGHIKVESEVGIGTKVFIYLPAEISDNTLNAEGVGADLQAIDEQVLSGRSILVVDDEQAICTMLTDLLTMYGASVTPFTSALEAMETFETNPLDFDIVITDETMPNLTGFEMALQMMALRASQPVILCSGFNNRVDETVCQEHGIKAYMRKPIELDQLIKNIDRFAVR